MSRYFRAWVGGYTDNDTNMDLCYCPKHKQYPTKQIDREYITTEHCPWSNRAGDQIRIRMGTEIRMLADTLY